MTTMLERIRLVGDLGKASADLRAAESPIAKIKAGAAVRALLDRLGVGKPTGSPELALDRNDAEASKAALRAYLDGGLASVPEPLRPFEARMLSELAGNFSDRELVTELRPIIGVGTDQENVDALSFISSRGLPIPFERESVLGSIKARDAARDAIKATKSAESAAINGKITALNEQSSAEFKLLMQKADAVRAAVRKGTASVYEENEILDALERSRAEHKARYNELVAEFNLKVKSPLSIPDIGQPEVRAEGQATIDAVMAASKVTDVQAREWAARQPIQKATAAYLKRAGYPEAKLRADMADFYRISGGKVPEIGIETAKSGRAHASGIDATVVRKSIAVGKNFGRKTLFHELGHHLEADASAYAAAMGYLLRRRRSPKTVRLSVLTGNNGYRPGELAYQDDFLHPYVGKVYPYRVTEVFSMGVEYLSDPESAAVMAAKDPELFALITGYLTQDSTPAMRALLALQREASDGNKSAESDIQEKLSSAIKSLASGIALSADGWWDAQESGGLVRRAVEFDAKKVKSYVGGFKSWHVITGTFKNRDTGRWQSGHMIIFDTGNSPDREVVFGGVEEAMALIRISHDDQVDVYRTKRNFFYKSIRSNYPQKLIDRAGVGA